MDSTVFLVEICLVAVDISIFSVIEAAVLKVVINRAAAIPFIIGTGEIISFWL